jgi:Asp/Glu/hydantoin racemase
MSIKIWHQSFTDLSQMEFYKRTLQEHAANVVGPETSVAVHGLRPGTYGGGIAPIDAIKFRYLEMLNEDQLCEAALAAERDGFDALAIGCFFDPALRAARSLVDIPVVSLAETCGLIACSYGRKFAVVTLCGEESANLVELYEQYGLDRRLAGVLSMDPPIDEFTLEAEDDTVVEVQRGFERACERALDLGAEVIVPGDGVLNEFLYRQGWSTIGGGTTVMDSIATLFNYAEMLVGLRRNSGMLASRRQMYVKPEAAMLRSAREFAAREALAEADFSGA